MINIKLFPLKKNISSRRKYGSHKKRNVCIMIDYSYSRFWCPFQFLLFRW